ncbi:hypothetical protein [Geobacillus phage GR1]|nr:hypothetical protein [Geobacillus phage GR1]
MTKNQDNFLYQINFNRKKYPEICEALERAKKDNGIAFYLRKLIIDDIYSKDKSIYVENKPVYKDNTSRIKIDKSINEDNKNELPDDSGGFV